MCGFFFQSRCLFFDPRLTTHEYITFDWCVVMQGSNNKQNKETYFEDIGLSL